MSIVLNNLIKTYGHQRVVNDVSLEIEPGELFVLLGASGSGKSTILRMIAGLTPFEGGQIWLHGRDVTHLPPQQRDTGFVFQNYSLFRHMTVASNIEFGLKVRRIPKRERQARVQELLTLIGLEDFGNRMPWQLSGGQQQRVALARALAPQPSILLLDEPFGALDVKIRAQLRHNLREIQQRLNISTILVTHDQEEAFQLADRIGVIDAGRLLEVGKPDQLYRTPQNRYTATFLGKANLLGAQRNGHALYLGDLSLPTPNGTEHLSNQPVDILFRPEEVSLSPSLDDLRGRYIGQGVVESITFSGALLNVEVRLTDHSPNPEQVIVAALTPDQMRAAGIMAGETVHVGIMEYSLLKTTV